MKRRLVSILLAIIPSPLSGTRQRWVYMAVLPMAAIGFGAVVASNTIPALTELMLYLFGIFATAMISLIMVLAVRGAVLEVKANRKADRIREHQCIDCGYNLHGNVTGVCSECGRILSRSEKHAE